MNRIRAILILLIPVFLKSLLYAEKGEVYEEIEKSNTPNGPEKKEEILFGGTLLSYTAHNVPARHLAFEQFFIFSNAYGLYNNNSKLKNGNHFSQLELLPYLKFGIINNLDLNIITSFTYSFAKKSDAASLGDTLVLFGIQLMQAKEDSWMPDMRLLVGESFPTGKYDKLNPKMNGADGVGSGSFETTFILSLAKVFPVSENHALRFNPNLYYIIPSNTNISNLSVYGGGEGTRGTAKPGNQIAFDFPCEYNITNHLILGLDIFLHP